MQDDKHTEKSLTKKSLDKVRAATLALLLLLSTTAGFAGGWIGANSRDTLSQGFTGNTETRREIVSSEGEIINEIAQNVGPSVVSVNVSSQGVARDFFGFSQEYEEEGAGTGVIISEDGLIVTNRHVVPTGVSDISVTLSDGTELTDVEVVGRTSSSDPLDIAFLKINDRKGKELKPAQLGDSGQMKVGDKVVAIGNALGRFQNSVTSGIISGFGRNVQAYDAGGTDTLQNLIQTDAAINQGNSGGPLVNLSGEVIGINTAVAGGGAENIGFAIPINDFKGLIESVKTTGRLERPYLGVRYVPLTDDLAFQFELSVKRGAFIVPSEGGSPSVIPNSPAAKAGLKEGDVITKVNDTAIDEDTSLTSVIGQKSVGDEVTLTYVRDGDERTTTVTLEAAPEN